MFHVLMVCTGNICRSPMAEGLLKWMLPESLKEIVSVSSVGTHALVGNRAEQNAVQVMENYGVDISHHRGRLIDSDIVRSSGLILVMESGHKRLIEKMTSKASNALMLGKFNPDDSLKDIFDPYGRHLEDYTRCAAVIHSCLDGVVEFLKRNIT
jgi:protein-tyrosine-phosphatase